jgi:hypothetical protein
MVFLEQLIECGAERNLHICFCIVVEKGGKSGGKAVLKCGFLGKSQVLFVWFNSMRETFNVKMKMKNVY